MDVTSIPEILSGGGMLALALVVWWELRQLRETLAQSLSDHTKSLSRLDERTEIIHRDLREALGGRYRNGDAREE